MQSGPIYSTWAEINLSAVENNVQQLMQTSGTDLMAIVKANAYGHGAVPVARTALQAGAQWLGVARIEEAVELRQAGVEGRILLLGYTPPARYATAIENDLSLTVWDDTQIEQISLAAQTAGKIANLHLKVDTGMSRLGTEAEGAAGLARRIHQTKGVVLQGVFTHFARADESPLPEGQPSTTQRQIEAFRAVVEQLAAQATLPEWIHAGNSAGILRYPMAHFNLVRSGIALYGLHPSKECPLPASFQPALAWKTVVSQVKTVPGGRGVSYGHIYQTQAEETLLTLPVGYADGFRRASGNQVLVAGQKSPVVGRVCMDQVIVRAPQGLTITAGDEVVLIGRQGEGEITAQQVADIWGTINYEVVCGIGQRVPRLHDQTPR